MHYGFSRTIPDSFDTAVERVTAALSDEGFGVLTTIDVQKTLREKLDVAFPRYVILGACNPPFAHRSLLAEEQIGLMLPCNVIVYEKDGAIVVAAFDPMVMTAVIDNPALTPIAQEVQARLRRVIESL